MRGILGMSSKTGSAIAQNYVGIDVSQARLDVDIRPVNITLKVANTKEEITT